MTVSLLPSALQVSGSQVAITLVDTNRLKSTDDGGFMICLSIWNHFSIVFLFPQSIDTISVFRIINSHQYGYRGFPLSEYFSNNFFSVKFSNTE